MNQNTTGTLQEDIAYLECARCPDHVEDIRVEDKVDQIIARWTEPNSEHPFEVAEMFFQAARFYIEQPKRCADKIFDCRAALGLLTSARNRWAFGTANLDRLAGAESLASILEEKSDPAVALTCAEIALSLWSRQLELDPANEHSRASCMSSIDRVLALITGVRLQAIALAEEKPPNVEKFIYLSKRIEYAQALVIRTRDALGETHAL